MVSVMLAIMMGAANTVSFYRASRGFYQEKFMICALVASLFLIRLKAKQKLLCNTDQTLNKLELLRIQKTQNKRWKKRYTPPLSLSYVLLLDKLNGVFFS